MDDAKKSALKGELMGIKGMISASTSSTGMLNQMAFPVTGTIVTIPGLPGVGTALKMQADCMEKLANILDKVITES